MEKPVFSNKHAGFGGAEYGLMGGGRPPRRINKRRIGETAPGEQYRGFVVILYIETGIRLCGKTPDP